MTFFANGGLTWPNLEQQTSIAGEATLEAGSVLWHLFASLERHNPADREDFRRNADTLEYASDTWREIARELDGQVVDELSPAEFEVAAVEGFVDYYFGRPSNRLERSRSLPIGEIYRELSRRTEMLAGALRAFEPDRNNRDLAPQAFGMMRQWEIIASLGRVITVLNRRRVENPISRESLL